MVSQGRPFDTQCLEAHWCQSCGASTPKAPKLQAPREKQISAKNYVAYTKGLGIRSGSSQVGW